MSAARRSPNAYQNLGKTGALEDESEILGEETDAYEQSEVFTLDEVR